jgi:hypothetical protein
MLVKEKLPRKRADVAGIVVRDPRPPLAASVLCPNSRFDHMEVLGDRISERNSALYGVSPAVRVADG